MDQLKKEEDTTKVYLNCPFSEKDAAKALGARWDPQLKKWYISAGKDPSPFRRWLRHQEVYPRGPQKRARSPSRSHTNYQGSLLKNPTGIWFVDEWAEQWVGEHFAQGHKGYCFSWLEDGFCDDPSCRFKHELPPKSSTTA